MVPAPDGGDDSVGIGGPGEGPGFGIVVVEEAVDGGLEVDDGAEDAALQGALGQGGEEGLDGVQPGAGLGWLHVLRMLAAGRQAARIANTGRASTCPGSGLAKASFFDPSGPHVDPRATRHWALPGPPAAQTSATPR